MPLTGNSVFLYCGKNSHGQFIEGRVRAENSEWAKHKLRKKGIKIQSLKKSWNAPFSHNQSIKPSDITQFTRQLAILLKAGIPIRRSFDIIANSAKKTSFKQIIRDINNDIYLGDSLAKSLRNHPRQFNDIFCNMISVGEISGTLTLSLERLANYQEKNEYLKKRVKKALTYPVIVLIISVLVASVMLTKVIPNFAQVYEDFSAELPFFTQLIISVSDTFSHVWPYVLGGLISCYIIIHLMIKNSLFAMRFAHKIILSFPLTGNLVKKVMLGRFTQTLATTISAGLPIIDALKSSASAMDNLYYKEAIDCIRDDIIKGLSLHRALSKQSIFPITLQQMVDVGEESGSLAPILEKAGQIYERDIELVLDTIIPLIEPVMMITLGLLVGGLLVAMYLPVFQLGHIV
ncbi:MAG: type II secretion system F family protein [Porticoccaceae bacterium]|nr:type II secretion system F family protein [Porticoccaceae bacterium]